MNKEPIIIGSDHAGFELKEYVKEILTQRGIELRDIGATSSEPGDDYPVYISEVAGAVARGDYTRGIAVDGVGVGASIVANRFPFVRAAMCLNSDMARVARAHIDANTLVLGGWITSLWHAEQILDTWLGTSFEGGRHARRVTQIEDNVHLKVALQHIAAIETKHFDPGLLDDRLVNRATKAMDRLRRLVFKSDRRDDHESRLPLNCPTSVQWKGHKVAALMTDLSEKGAQFQLCSDTKRIDLRSGDVISMEIKTPYGKTECKGKVKWIDTSFCFSWGMVFLGLPRSRSNPIRALMESSM